MPRVVGAVFSQPGALGVGHGRPAQGVLAGEPAPVQSGLQIPECGRARRVGSPLRQPAGEVHHEAEAVLEIPDLGFPH